MGTMEAIVITYRCNSLPRYKGRDRVVSLLLASVSMLVDGTATESCVPTCPAAPSVSPVIPELTPKGHRTIFAQLATGRVSQQDEQVRSQRSRSGPSLLWGNSPTDVWLLDLSHSGQKLLCTMPGGQGNQVGPSGSGPWEGWVSTTSGRTAERFIADTCREERKRASEIPPLRDVTSCDTWYSDHQAHQRFLHNGSHTREGPSPPRYSRGATTPRNTLPTFLMASREGVRLWTHQDATPVPLAWLLTVTMRGNTVPDISCHNHLWMHGLRRT